MARIPLQPSETGKVRTTQVKPALWLADAYYCDHAGVKARSRKFGRTEAAARRALMEEIDARLDLGAPAESQVSSSTRVSEAVEVYLTNRMQDARNGIGRANPRSVKTYRSVAENWIVPSLGQLQVRHLIPGRLDSYFRNDVPPSRYADVRKALHAFIKWLIVQGAHSRDPVEALALRRRDLDLNYRVAPGVTGPVAHLTGTVVYDSEHSGLYRQPHTKSNGAGDRTVILPPFVASMLRERLMASPPNENDAVFASRTGNWLSLNNINTRFRDSILKGTEVGQWFELRLLRSATGTFVANEFGAEAAAAQMGNTREIAETHYIHRSRVAPDHSSAIQAAWQGAFDS
jgi:integrase